MKSFFAICSLLIGIQVSVAQTPYSVTISEGFSKGTFEIPPQLFGLDQDHFYFYQSATTGFPNVDVNPNWMKNKNYFVKISRDFASVDKQVMALPNKHLPIWAFQNPSGQFFLVVKIPYSKERRYEIRAFPIEADDLVVGEEGKLLLSVDYSEDIDAAHGYPSCSLSADSSHILLRSNIPETKGHRETRWGFSVFDTELNLLWEKEIQEEKDWGYSPCWFITNEGEVVMSAKLRMYKVNPVGKRTKTRWFRYHLLSLSEKDATFQLIDTQIEEQAGHRYASFFQLDTGERFYSLRKNLEQWNGLLIDPIHGKSTSNIQLEMPTSDFLRYLDLVEELPLSDGRRVLLMEEHGFEDGVLDKDKETKFSISNDGAFLRRDDCKTLWILILDAQLSLKKVY
ncbi:MAG: hypothetical protein AAF399_26320, partial [Bacteroidota bacterium]